MEENNVAAIPSIGPDLFQAPHVLPALMELLAGERLQVFLQQEQLQKHLETCHYCRIALSALLETAQEYDRRNNNSQKPVRDLLAYFTEISQAIETTEAGEYESLGMYAEAVVAEGEHWAEQRFPTIAAHLKICERCHSATEATVAFLEAEKEDTTQNR